MDRAFVSHPKISINSKVKNKDTGSHWGVRKPRRKTKEVETGGRAPLVDNDNDQPSTSSALVIKDNLPDVTDLVVPTIELNSSLNLKVN